jgi:hypothetical protein
MKNKIGTSKSMKKYGPGGTADSKPVENDAPPVSRSSVDPNYYGPMGPNPNPGKPTLTNPAPGYKKGGSVGKKKMGMRGMHEMPDGSMMKNSMMKKGGMVGKKPKMAKGGSVPFKALAKPYDKATYADKIAGATMKKGGMVKSKKK